MVTFHGSSYEIFNIIVTKIYIIGKYLFLRYTCQSLNLMNKRGYVGKNKLFYFNNNGKQDLFHIPKKLNVEKLLFFELNSLKPYVKEHIQMSFMFLYI